MCMSERVHVHGCGHRRSRGHDSVRTDMGMDTVPSYVSNRQRRSPWTLTVLERYNPQYAIDGDISTMYHSANKVTHPWWMIDLQATVYVFSVDTITRQGGFEYRFHNIEVRVGFTPPSDEDFSSWLLLGFYQGPYSYDQGTITFSNSAGLCGRYVVVQRVSSDFDQLQLAEVQVFAKSIL
ncbi:pentraxin fusion protein-like [Penaeus japonicus]|uniref:pentraxin fusion protein-like n=1 Tax=Penaeus japonicus TaxID=27405 RepID=UPI001C70C054|nr:pentraxin fusion protein-like [Penaeus japonicus]